MSKDLQSSLVLNEANMALFLRRLWCHQFANSEHDLGDCLVVCASFFSS